MAIIRESRIVDVPKHVVFDVISDVSSYERFLPWCSRSYVSRSADGRLVGTIQIRSGPIAQSFSSSLSVIAGEKVSMVSHDGPFRFMKGEWRVRDVPGGTRVSIEIDFQIRSPVLQRVFDPVFRSVVGKMIQAFEQRARLNHCEVRAIGQ